MCSPFTRLDTLVRLKFSTASNLPILHRESAFVGCAGKHWGKTAELIKNSLWLKNVWGVNFIKLLKALTASPKPCRGKTHKSQVTPGSEFTWFLFCFQVFYSCFLVWFHRDVLFILSTWMRMSCCDGGWWISSFERSRRHGFRCSVLIFFCYSSCNLHHWRRASAALRLSRPAPHLQHVVSCRTPLRRACCCGFSRCN